MRLCNLLLSGLLISAISVSAAKTERKREKKPRNEKKTELAQEADLMDPRTPKMWYSNYARALEKANDQKTPRLLLLYFTCSEERKWCKKMDQDVLKDSRVKSLINKRMIPVWLDFPLKRKLPDKLKEQNQNLRDRFASGCQYPTIVIVSADEKELGKISGYVDARGFYKQLQDILPPEKGKSSEKTKSPEKAKK